MIERRAVVHVPFGGKNRVAIVLDAEDAGMVGVIAVTGTDRDLDRVEVSAGSREAKAIGGIYKDSYFYPSNIAAVPAEQCTVQRGRCPPELYERLLDLRRRAATQG